MKFLHLADLHIGKRVNEFLMLEEQEYALKQILKICEEKSVDTVLMAGDIYDRSIPVIDAVKIFDWFLTELNKKNIDVFIISGNHDSPQRLDFGKNIMESNNVFIEGIFSGEIRKISKEDSFGKINIYMLPFIRPSDVKDEKGARFEDYTEAVNYLVKKAEINKSERNIILSHQFVTKGTDEVERCESEAISVGGLDNVDSFVYDDFDYVALGHLHSPQKVGRDTLRYAGSLIKYSFSEVRHKKSVPIVEFGEKDDIKIELMPLYPLRDMREIKGEIEEIINAEGNREDYIKAVVTNEEEIYDAIGQLRAVYPNIMKLEFQNKKSAFNENAKTGAVDLKDKSPENLFEEFFVIQNNIEMNKEQKKIISEVFKEIGGDTIETN